VDLVILIYGASPTSNQIKYKNRNQILYTLLNGSKNTRYYTDGTQQLRILDLVIFIYGDFPISNQKKYVRIEIRYVLDTVLIGS